MRKRIQSVLLVLLAAVMLLVGCGGQERTYTQSRISFLDNVQNDGKAGCVVLWQQRPTTYRRLTSVVNVLAPTWLYVSAGENGTQLLDTAQMGDAVDYASYVQLANKDGISVWAGVVCDDAKLMRDVLENESVRKGFVEKVVSFSQQSAVNGVNLYFPLLQSEDAQAFAQLSKELSEALSQKTLLNACVTFTPGSMSDAQQENAYDYRSLAEHCDYLLLMAFEQYGLSSSTAGPICSYEWLYSNVIKILSMVSSQQLVLILPFYGRDFRFGATGEALWVDNAAQAPVVSYAQVEELFLQSQYYDSNQALTTASELMTGKEAWDKTYHTAYTKFTDTDGVMHVIWYDDEQSMCDKSAIAVQYALAGIGAYADAYSDTTLWKGVRTAMDGSYFSGRMLQMMQLYAKQFQVYNPETEKWVDADDVATQRLINLLSASRSDASSGIDTGYILRSTLRMNEDENGYTIRWIVKEKNGRYLLVPDNEYTSIITGGQSLWLPVGFTPEMLEGVCLVRQDVENAAQ